MTQRNLVHSFAVVLLFGASLQATPSKVDISGLLASGLATGYLTEFASKADSSCCLKNKAIQTATVGAALSTVAYGSKVSGKYNYTTKSAIQDTIALTVAHSVAQCPKANAFFARIPVVRGLFSDKENSTSGSRNRFLATYLVTKAALMAMPTCCKAACASSATAGSSTIVTTSSQE